MIKLAVSLILALISFNAYAASETVQQYSTELDAVQAVTAAQSGNAGKFLKTDGTNLSWATPSGGGGGGLTTAVCGDTFVTDFGADATGVSDSQSAFTSAASAAGSGGVVCIPAGTYKLNSNVTSAATWLYTGVVSFTGTGKIQSYKEFDLSTIWSRRLEVGLNPTLAVGTYNGNSAIGLVNGGMSGGVIQYLNVRTATAAYPAGNTSYPNANGVPTSTQTNLLFQGMMYDKWDGPSNPSRQAHGSIELSIEPPRDWHLYLDSASDYWAANQYTYSTGIGLGVGSDLGEMRYLIARERPSTLWTVSSTAMPYGHFAIGSGGYPTNSRVWNTRTLAIANGDATPTAGDVTAGNATLVQTHWQPTALWGNNAIRAFIGGHVKEGFTFTDLDPFGSRPTTDPYDSTQTYVRGAIANWWVDGTDPWVSERLRTSGDYEKNWYSSGTTLKAQMKVNSTHNTIFLGTTGYGPVGTSCAGYKFSFYGNIGSCSSTDYAIGIDSGQLWFNTNADIAFKSGGVDKFYISATGTATVGAKATATATGACWNGNTLAACSSSKRFKKNIQLYSGSLDKVLKLQPAKFDWIGNKSETKDIGLIAEEVEKAAPEFVTYEGGKIQGVKYEQLTVLLINAIKEQQKQIDELKAAK